MKAITATSPPHTRREAAGRLDEAAFTQFYRTTSHPLWSYVYRVTGNPADADDIVQESFLRVLRTATDAADDDEGRRRYLYRVASNLIVDRWRRRARDQASDGSRAAQSAIDAASPVSREGSECELMARTFARLTPRERALLWLAYVEEESHADIAASLGVGRSSVRVLLFRARRRLRDLLTSRGRVART